MALRIVFLDTDTIPAHINIAKPNFDHHWQSYPSTNNEQLIERAQSADIIITNKVPLTADSLALLPNVKLIAIAATGTNNVDLNACRHRGITVCNIRGYATCSVPEHVLSLIFALKRNLLNYHRDIAQGVWQQQAQFCFFNHPIGDVAGSKLGIIGNGSLGQAVATLARAVGMEVICAEHKHATTCRDGYLPFDTVLAEADILSLHCPLNADTENVIGRAEFARMPSHALLINTGRGGLVDEHALVDALKQGDIAGAGVDVLTSEPPQADNPLLLNAALPNLLLTPHVAWGSDSAIQTLCDQLIDNLNAWHAGSPQHQV